MHACWSSSPKLEKKEEFIKVIKNEVLPILKKQTGFLEILPFFPEVKTEKARFVSLWTEKKHFERYEKEWYPKVEEIIKPYLTTPVTYTSTRLRPLFASTSRRPDCLAKRIRRERRRPLPLHSLWLPSV